MQLDHDGLDLFAAHHRAHAPARRQTRRPPVAIGKSNPGQESLILADRTTQPDGDIFAVACAEHVGNFNVTFAQVRRGVVEGEGAVLVEVEHDPVVRLAVQGQARNFQATQAVGEGPTAVRFLNAAGEWAFAAHARAIGVGEGGAGEGPGGKDQGIVRPERVDSGHLAVHERFGDQVPPGFDQGFAVQLLGIDTLMLEVNMEIASHGVLLYVRISHSRMLSPSSGVP